MKITINCFQLIKIARLGKIVKGILNTINCFIKTRTIQLVKKKKFKLAKILDVLQSYQIKLLSLNIYA